MVKIKPKCKIVIIGKGGVGKSAITLRFTQDKFIDIYDPTVMDTYRRTFIVDGNAWDIEIIDTSGQDEFTVIRDMCVKMGDGFIIVFALDDRNSFELIESYHKSILKIKDVDWIPCIVFGNKSDIVERRIIDIDRAFYTAHYHQCNYCEGSALTGDGIDDTFKELIRLIEVSQRTNVNRKRKQCLLF